MTSLARQKNLMEKFEDLIFTADPDAIFEEVCRILAVLHPDFDFGTLDQVFQDVVRLFRGEFPGYQACNTGYHDLRHTTNCLLTMVRLIHGASLNGLMLRKREVALGLIAALFHDIGYIQSDTDVGGTGAKYTRVHEKRSIAFMEKYLTREGYSSADLDYCRCCVNCTGLEVKIKEIPFQSDRHQAVGWMLGAADLLGQMADCTYLERLPYLYREFQEGKVPGFKSELDLLRRTPAFWEFTKFRLIVDLGNVDRYMRDHFKVWWGLDQDLNREFIEENITYLKFILENHESEYPEYLRRAGLMEVLGGRA